MEVVAEVAVEVAMEVAVEVAKEVAVEVAMEVAMQVEVWLKAADWPWWRQRWFRMIRLGRQGWVDWVGKAESFLTTAARWWQ